MRQTSIYLPAKSLARLDKKDVMARAPAAVLERLSAGELSEEDLAQRYLEDRSKSATDVTFLLGYSQQSAFTRAFRRWTGMSPTEYRARRAPQPAAGSRSARSSAFA